MSQQTPKKRVLFVRRFMPVLLVVFGVLSLFAFTLRSPKIALAATNNNVNFQARLKSAAGAIAPDGYYNVEFKLYSASSGGAALWTEDYIYNGGSPDQRIQVINGYLSTPLGSVTAFPSTINWDQQLYLTMNIGGSATTTTWDGEMSPRLPLTSVPYALSAGQLQTTSGANTSKLSIQAPTGGSQTFVLQDQGAAGTYNLLTTNVANNNYIQLQASSPGTAQTGNINITGTAIAATLQGSTQVITPLLDYAGGLSIGTASATSISIGKSGVATTVKGNINIGTSAGSGLVFTNNGVLVNSTLALTNFASGGSIGSAATTVDLYTAISVAQTTASQTLTLPSPTASTSYGRMLYISNIGTNSFTLLGTPLSPGATATLVWSNTNGGASWQYAGSDGNSILNQNASTQTGNFNINGTGTVATLNATTGVQTGGTTRLDSSGNLSNIGNIAGSGTLQLSGTTGSSYIMSALGLGTTNPQSGAAVTIANSSWISAIDSAGTGYVNMFQVNTSNQIQVGASLNIDGYIVLPTNGGQMTFADLPIDTSATAGTAESYSLRIGSSNVLTVYGEADGSGNLQNGRIAIGTSIAPAYTLDVAGDINTTGSHRVNGTIIINSSGVLQSVGLSGTYSNALTLSSASNAYTGATASLGTSVTSPLVQSAGGAALTITGNAASTWSTSAGLLTISGAGGVTVNSANATTSSAVTIQSGNSSGGAAGTVTLDNGTSSSGGGIVNIGTSTSNHTINIGNSSTGTQAILLGASGTGANTTDIRGGNGASAITLTTGNNGTTAGTISIGNSAGAFTQTINLGTNATASSSTTVNIGSTIAGATTLQSAGGVNVSGSLTVGASAGSGTVFKNNGATVNTVYTMANLATGGWDAGGAAATVDKYTYIAAGQTTASQALTLPAPTANTTYGRTLYLTNTGTANFTFTNTYLTAILRPGATTTLIWALVNGTAAWTYAGSDGSGILNQTTQQTSASFNIDGSGTIGTTLSVGGQTVFNSSGILQSAALSGTYSNALTFSSATNSFTGATANLGTSVTTPLLQSAAATALTITANAASTWSTSAGLLTVNGAGGLTLSSTTTGVVTLDSGTTGNVNVGTGANAKAVAVGNNTGATSLSLTAGTGGVSLGNGGVANTIQIGNTTGAVAQTINLGTNATASSTSTVVIGSTIAGTTTIQGAGGISLNGTVTVGASAGNGSLVNNGATVNTVYTMANLASGGWDAGGAAATVDKYTYIAAAQTTASQTLTIPAPTANTTYGRLLYVGNTGTSSFTFTNTYLTATLRPGATTTLVWSLVNGTAAWTYAGADGSGILNQNATQTGASFNIDGTGVVGTSITTPLLQSAASTALTLTGNAASTWGTSAGLLTISGGGGVTVSSAAGTTSSAITIQTGNASSGASGNITIDNGTFIGGTPTITVGGTSSRSITIGNTTAATATNILGGSTGGINIGSTGSSTASSTVNIGNTSSGTGTQAISIGSSANVANSLVLEAGANGQILIGNLNSLHNINIGSGGSSTAQAINIGSSSTGSQTTIQGSIINLITGSAASGLKIKTGINSTLGFQIQNSSNVSYFNVDTTNSTITLGDSTSGNYITYTTSGGLQAFGTTQHTRIITLSAEYAGAVLDAASDSSCSSANNGTMTSGFDSTNFHNYYKWSANATAQCYDVVVRVPIPSDFSSWSSSTPITIKTYTSATATGLINIDAKDTSNTAESSCAYASATPGSNTTWTTAGSSCTIAGTYAANGTMTLRIRMTGNNSSDVRIGNITLSYNSKY